MGALVLAISSALVLIVVLTSVIVAGCRLDRRWEAAVGSHNIVDEAEEIVRRAYDRIRRESEHRSS